MDWSLCCLCQIDKAGESLQTPKNEGLVSLERDLNDFNDLIGALPQGMNVSLNQLDDGQGIADTLKLHNAKYHKVCRTYCSNSRLKRAREKEEREDRESVPHSSPKKLRSSSEPMSEANCVICEKAGRNNLHKVLTLSVDANLKNWAQTCKNFALLGRLTCTASDAHAADIYYHHECYVRLRDSASAVERKKSGDSSPKPPPFDTIVCAQIIATIENSDQELFKLSDLREYYRNLMSDMGQPCKDKKEPHSTRFKDYLLSLLPEWSEYSKDNKGRKDVYISNSSKVVDELSKAYTSQICQEDALTLMRAAAMLHKRCLQKQEPFTGSFSPNCTTSVVSREMRCFFNVVLQGSSVLRKRDFDPDNANPDPRDKIACNISQLLMYNCTSSTHHEVKTSTVRHNKARETPFPLYQGLRLHGHGRNKDQIKTDYENGISVSYYRVMEVKRGIARAVCARHKDDGIVLPTNMRSNVFTTHDVDNIDSKAQGNFSQNEFHGYALSVTNHLSHDNIGRKRPSIKIDPSDSSVPKLPDWYVTQPLIHLPASDIYAPKIENNIFRPIFDVSLAKEKDNAWITECSSMLAKDTLAEGDIITWAGYNSNLASKESVKPPAEIGVYPLFPEKAASASSMKHAMELTIKGTQFLNPGQTSVLGADQPLFAIIKTLQWLYPDTLGEDKLVVMMGALHIEDKMHLMAGKLLADSGWASILSKAGVLTSGRAESALNEHHIKRTRYAHQVTLMALYILKQAAFDDYCESTTGPHESFDMWESRCRSNVPLCQFWSMIQELELLMCRFVRSLREGDFKLYVQTCDELCAWFHVLDHTNYARWLPVHVRDMLMLVVKHPLVYEEFMKGNFVVQKSAKKFSLIAKDQAHEQSNKILQAHGGAVGLYEDDDALLLFMLTAPDCARIVKEFEATNTTNDESAHHEEAHSLQLKFKKDVQSFVKVVEQLGNPFRATSQELVSLDTQCVVEPSVVDSLSTIHEVGRELHQKYVSERLEKVTVPVSDTIKRNNKLTFANRPDTKKQNVKGVQRQNMLLITQLFLSLQSRPDANMEDFFKFENQREPPSLSDRGMLRSGTKSDILQCIKAPMNKVNDAKQVEVIVFDMAAVVHMIRPTAAKTFSEYVRLHIIPYMESQVTTNTERIDAIWDNYPEDSLKATAHLKRGSGARTRIGDGSTPIPKHEWSNFLKNEDNKKELFSFVSREIAKADMCGKLLLTTHFESVLSNRQCDTTTIEPCNHSEADSRIFLHLFDAAQKGCRTAYIRTVDSDVVVLAVNFFETLGFTELWVGFGSGKHYRDIPVHTICSEIGPSKAKALPLFHSLTGCDTTSQFLGCGKKSAWAAWALVPEMTHTLVTLTQDPSLLTLESVHMQCIERFVILMYSKGCSATGVNLARYQLFSTGSKSLENIPPSQAALFQHIKRALLQACFFWKQAIIPQQDIPDFSEWGWHKVQAADWQPLWTTLSDASDACAILLHCGCQKACTGRCKCSRAGVRCTVLCKCEGGCVNNSGEEN